METIQKIVKWFIDQTNTNKIAIILISVMCVMYVDRVDFKDELKILKRERKKTDSIYTIRLNRLTDDFQEKINDCNNKRLEDYYKQSQMWQEKFDELFKETDNVYQKYHQLIKKQ
tara:strand:+ start:168 stop:512 length:345 start_codon:yes stop_codon:yes gene_type:complete